MGAKPVSSEGTLRSMTGYADTRGVFQDWTWTADVRSVNGRGLDLRLRVPDWVSGLEPEVRKFLQGALARGTVSLNLRVQRAEGDGSQQVNEAALSAALARVAQVQTAADGAGVQLAPASAADILSMRGVIETGDGPEEDTAPLKAAITASIEGMIADFNENRAREGAALAGVLSDQLAHVENLVASARRVADERSDGARAALERGLARLLDATEVPDEARLRQEMALLAVKNDVTEEMDRLDGHVTAARTLMSDGGAIGRKFDFLMQEFNREANTLCSKAQSQELTAVGLDLKAVIDQMREQVQNLE